MYLLYNNFCIIKSCAYKHRQYTKDYKLKTYLRIARLYLDCGEIMKAETFVNRASLLHADQEPEFVILHKECHARVLDFKG